MTQHTCVVLGAKDPNVGCAPKPVVDGCPNNELDCVVAPNVLPAVFVPNRLFVCGVEVNGNVEAVDVVFVPNAPTGLPNNPDVVLVAGAAPKPVFGWPNAVKYK